VEYILASRRFASSERHCRLLRYLLEQTLEGRGDQLKEYVLGVEVFDRQSSFDPQTDPIVRSELSRLRAKLKDYYEGEGRDDSVIIDLPKRSYSLLFQLREAPAMWLSAGFLPDLVQYELRAGETGLRLQFQINHPALETIYRQRLGRTLLITNRFRGLKGGDWLHWGPMHHWTDSKIRIHAFYCLLGISLLNHVHRQAQQVWPQLTTERLKDELEEICETVLLYPPQEKGPYRTATVLSCQSLIQKTLADTLALQRVCSTHRG